MFLKLQILTNLFSSPSRRTWHIFKIILATLSLHVVDGIILFLNPQPSFSQNSAHATELPGAYSSCRFLGLTPDPLSPISGPGAQEMTFLTSPPSGFGIAAVLSSP